MWSDHSETCDNSHQLWRDALHVFAGSSVRVLKLQFLGGVPKKVGEAVENAQTGYPNAELHLVTNDALERPENMKLWQECRSSWKRLTSISTGNLTPGFLLTLSSLEHLVALKGRHRRNVQWETQGGPYELSHLTSCAWQTSALTGLLSFLRTPLLYTFTVNASISHPQNLAAVFRYLGGCPNLRCITLGTSKPSEGMNNTGPRLLLHQVASPLLANRQLQHFAIGLWNTVTFTDAFIVSVASSCLQLKLFDLQGTSTMISLQTLATVAEACQSLHTLNIPVNVRSNIPEPRSSDLGPANGCLRTIIFAVKGKALMTVQRALLTEFLHSICPLVSCSDLLDTVVRLHPSKSLHVEGISRRFRS